MENVRYKRTDGNDIDFQKFYLSTEEYYSSIVGGVGNRKGFIPYNISESVKTVIIAYIENNPVGCAGLKPYSDTDAEIKRVWVEPQYRRHHISVEMMKMIEDTAKLYAFSEDCTSDKGSNDRSCITI